MLDCFDRRNCSDAGAILRIIHLLWEKIDSVPVAADSRGVCDLAQDRETALVAFGQLLQRVNTRTYSQNKRILLLSSDLKAEDLTQKGETALVACIHINRCLEGSIIPHVLGKFF